MVVMCIINKSLYAFLFVSLLISQITKAQSAEELFSDYWKIGIGFNGVSYFTHNERNSVDYKLYSPKVSSINLIWNFYQKDNHNIKTSISKSLKYMDKSYLRIKAEDIPFEVDYIEEVSVNNGAGQWKANIIYEYFVPFNNLIYVSFALGPEVLYYPEIRAGGSMGIGLGENGQYIVRVNEQTERVKDINLGLKGEASIFLASKIGLFQFRIEGLLGLNDYQETNVKAFNLEVSPDSHSEHTIKGHYLGFGVGYYLTKGKTKK